MIFAALALLVAGLIGLYMLRPRFRPVRISVPQRFFEHQPPPEGRSLVVTPPTMPMPFWVRITVFILFLAACAAQFSTCAPRGDERIGLWLYLDTSYSMSTSEAGKRWADDGHREAIAAIEHAAADGVPVCFRIAAFDLSVHDARAVNSATAAADLVRALKPNAAGTNLSAVFADMARIDPACPATHIVVVTDAPLPVMSSETPLVWRQVGQPVANHGIHDVVFRRDPLTGNIDAINVEVLASGDADPVRTAEVTAPDGSVVEIAPVARDGASTRFRFQPHGKGQYIVSLPFDDAYGGDDRAVFTVPDGMREPLVSCQGAGCDAARMMGWREGTPASLRLTDDPSDRAEMPTIIVAGGYARGRRSVAALFSEDSMLEGLNLDVTDEAGMSALSVDSGFSTLLAQQDGAAWVALRSSPPAVFVPGAPLSGDDAVSRASWVLWSNALRWLRSHGARAWDNGYRLQTHDGREIRDGLREFPYDGRRAASGEIADIVPQRSGAMPTPLWPYFVLAATCVWSLDGVLAGLRGPKWT